MDKDALIDVDIYEAAAQITQVGAGISVWPRTWEILRTVGLENTLIKYLGTTEVLTARRIMTYRKSDQKKGFDFAEIINAGGVTFHRAELQETLLSKISPRYRIHLSHRLASYIEKDNAIELSFENGTTKACDFLVGADGVKSATRRQFLSNRTPEEAASIDPIWTGTNAYRGLVSGIDMAKLHPDHPALSKFMVYCGKHKHIVSYPISQGTHINVVALFSEPEKEGTLVQGPLVCDATVDEIISTYEGWDEEVVSYLRLLETPTKWAMQKVKPMKYYASGRILLLGDAAHAMPPHLGSGGGQAIEDAYIFSVLLSTALRERKPLSEVTRVYNAIRVPVGNQVMAASMMQGALADFDVPGINNDIQDGDYSVSVSQLQTTAEAIKKNWDFVALTSIEPDRKKALDMLLGTTNYMFKL
ncbi:salicylate hydroxylase [Cyathus striatus]|nr:salicylate hydroxylase [Cyathus striatus]